MPHPISLALFVTLLFSSAVAQPATRGREFLIAFLPTNGYDDLPAHTLWISSPRPTRCDFTYSVSGERFSVAIPDSNRAVRIELDTLSLLLQDPRFADITRRTLIVTSGDEVTIRGINDMRWSSDAFLALPTAQLGRNYVVVSWPNTQQPNPLGEIPGVSDFPSQFAVVGVEDDTRVTIGPTARINGEPVSTPFTISLDRGDVFLARADGPVGTDLTGSTIEATRPVAVFTGHQRANVPFTEAVGRDHLVEQLLPLEHWRTRFISAPHAPRGSTARGLPDLLRVVAAEENTTLEVSGMSAMMLRRGEPVDFPLDSARLFVASKPVLAMQLAHSSVDAKLIDNYADSLGDPFLTTVTAIDQFDTSYTIASMASPNIAEHYVDVTISERALTSLRIDGAPVAATSHEVLGASYRYLTVRLDTGSHRLTADEPFGATVYGYGPYNSYAYPAGMVFTPIPLRVDGGDARHVARLAVHPNPVSGGAVLTIETARPMSAELEIVDMHGAIVMRRILQLEAGAQRLPIDAAELPDGLYIARIESGGCSVAVATFSVVNGE